MLRLLTISILLSALATGCGTTTPTQVVELDPLVLHANGGRVRAVEPRSLFKEASADYQHGRDASAARKFQEVAKLFPQTNYAPHALFNAGLAYQRMAQWTEALDVFERSEARLNTEEDRWDSRFQQVICLEKLERDAEVAKLAPRVLTRSKLTVVQRIETRARLGIAQYKLGRLARAEHQFKKLLEDYRQNTGVPLLKGNAYVSRAQYLIGEIYRGLFASIKFRLPVETMKRDLTDKSSFFLKGQSAYLRCIRLSNRYWSVAAGYKLGRLYQDFYDDMMAAEVPPELDADDRVVYFKELKKHIKPLVVRAIEVYERNLGMSDRLGAGKEWADKTQASLEQMRTILRTEFSDEPE